MRMSFCHMVMVKFYFDVITRSRLQLIDTFFSKLHAFLVEQKKRRKANDGYKRKLDGTVDKSSADQKIHKSDLTVHNL